MRRTGKAGMETIELKVDDGGVVRNETHRVALARRKQERGTAHTFSASTRRVGSMPCTHATSRTGPGSAEDTCGRTRKPGKASGGTRNTAKLPRLRTSPERGEMPDYLIDEIERAESQPMVGDLVYPDRLYRSETAWRVPQAGPAVPPMIDGRGRTPSAFAISTNLRRWSAAPASELTGVLHHGRRGPADPAPLSGVR